LAGVGSLDDERTSAELDPPVVPNVGADPHAASGGTHSPLPRPPARPDPDLGRAESGHEPAFIHLAPAFLVRAKGLEPPPPKGPGPKPADERPRMSV
jgi:hypothetical protein